MSTNKNRMRVWVDREHGGKKLFLPNDLFELSIGIDSTELILSFIKWILMISEKKGTHFNDHYMHDQILIKEFYINSLYETEQIVPYVDIIRSINVSWREFSIIQDANMMSLQDT